MPNRKNITGQRFGRLVVLEPRERGEKKTSQHWFCQCDCGKTTITRGTDLRLGRTRSCGCLRLRTTHGGYSTRAWLSWHMMRQRCQIPSNPDYPNYGGRGITVCDRWDKFENFFADMGERPEGLTLDRINNDGNYEPTNCRWATLSEQRLNQRDRPRTSRATRSSS